MPGRALSRVETRVGSIFLVFFVIKSPKLLISATLTIEGIHHRKKMNLLDRYLRGDHFEVYEEIERMGKGALARHNVGMVEAIHRETMNRVAYNLGVIYSGLVEEKYCFHSNLRFDFEYPLLEPFPNAKDLIRKLEKKVKKFGHVPLSLKSFYEIVGSCNFGWDYNAIDEIPWKGADPIQIGPITDLLEEVEDMEIEDEEPGLSVSADFLHKDNVSGGPCYAVELTAGPQADSRLLNEEHETSFINYLRIVMEGCGFSRAGAVGHLDSFVQFSRKIKPQLKPI
jgi:hypothetical protein